MTTDLAAAIRRHLTSAPPAQSARQSYDAVLAVVDKCDQLRAAKGAVYRDDAAAEFEQTIARALGITH